MATLFIKPRHGLANRLMGLAAGLRLSRLYGFDIKVIWQKQFGFVAGPEVLFEALDIFTDSDACASGVEMRIDATRMGVASLSQTALASGRDIFIECNHVFYSDLDGNKPRQLVADQLSRALSRLRWHAAIRMALRQFDGIDFSRGIGLHIRRPYPNWQHHPELSNEKTFLKPSDDFYVGLISSLRDQGYNGPVFLATNGEDTRQSLVGRIDGLHFYPARSYDSVTSAEAVQDACIDMLMLARAGIVTKFSQSSYAFMASIIGGAKQAIIYDNEEVRITEPLLY